jgi:hypothetical protein
MEKVFPYPRIFSGFQGKEKDLPMLILEIQPRTGISE